MPPTEFGNLVARLLEGMGESMSQIREVPEGTLVKTSDEFLFAFLEDPSKLSLGFVQRLVLEVGGSTGRLVVLTPGRLPPALSAEIERARGSIVEGARFRELARGLGLAALLGEEPRPEPGAARPRLLPSARQLDEIMTRARSWESWSVPALALRFYRQAGEMKPGFLPAKTGAAQALLSLGLAEEADRLFTEVLASEPANLEARIGRATVLGRRGRGREEIEALRALERESPGRPIVRASIVAALVDMRAWSEARPEIEAMLAERPDDGRLRLLHAAALFHQGDEAAAGAERERARALGLPYDRELALALQLGLAPPPRPVPRTVEERPTAVVVAPPPSESSPRPADRGRAGRRRPAGRAASKPPPVTATRRPAPRPASRKPKKRGTR